MNIFLVGRHRRVVLGSGLVIGVILGVLYATQDYYPGAYAYALADAIAASTALVVLGAVVSLLGAYQMSIVVDIWGRLEIRRSAIRVVGGLLVPVIVTGAVMTVVVYAMFLKAGVLQVGSYFLPASVTIAGLVAWTLVGAALGVSFRPTIAYPHSFIGPLFITSFPVSWEPFWLRHLTGVFFDCCTLDADLNPRVAAGSLLAMAGITLLALSVLVLRLGPLKPKFLLAAATVCVALGLMMSAASTVKDLGHSPAVERAHTDAVCADGVCVWPEAGSTLEANRRSWVSVHQGWLTLGVPLDPAMGIGPFNTGEQLGLVVLSEDEETIKESMVALLPELLLECDEPISLRQDGGDAAAPANIAQYKLTWLLGQKAGLPEHRLNGFKLGFDIEPTSNQAAELWAASYKDCG